MSPKVSVILPTYNRRHVLERAIKSVVGQTFQDFELIVVDDGSTDETAEFLASLRLPMMKVIRFSNNRGQCAARNEGIRVSTGSYIAFQDSDDEWLPQKLEVQVSLLDDARQEFGACYGRISRILDGRPFATIPSREEDRETLTGDIFERLLDQNVVDPPALMVRRDVFADVGNFDQSLLRLEDWDLALRIAKRYKFVLDDSVHVLSYYSSAGVNERNDPRGYYKILSKHRMDYLERDRRLGGWKFWEAANLFIEAKDLKSARAALKISLEMDGNFMRRLVLIATYSGMRSFLVVQWITRQKQFTWLRKKF